MSAKGSRLELSKHQQVSLPLNGWPGRTGCPIVRADYARNERRPFWRKKRDARLTERRWEDREC